MNTEMEVFICCALSHESGKIYGRWIDLTMPRDKFNYAVKYFMDNSPFKEHSDFYGDIVITEYRGFGSLNDKALSQSMQCSRTDLPFMNRFAFMAKHFDPDIIRRLKHEVEMCADYSELDTMDLSRIEDLYPGSGATTNV